MKHENEWAELKNENWADVYADVPESVQLGVQFAFMRIRAREKRRRNTLRALACAACVALVVGAAGLALRMNGRENVPDRVISPDIELQMLHGNDIVYAAQADACFHVRSDCDEAMTEQVEMQLQTALEFEKKLCPVCGAHVRLPE